MLDPRHTTNSLCADQIMPFARAVGLEATLYGLLKTFLLRACGVESLGGREQLVRSPCPSVIESTVADSLASQSVYSLPSVSGSWTTAVSVDNVGPGGVQQ